jgi:ribosomal protein S18 acetylase RimI-like enzyme
MRYIISISGGAGSTLAAHRAVEKHGLENVDLVFADTNTEHPDLYRLLGHMEATLKPIIRLNDGRDIWDAFDQHGIIRTPTGACKASLELKKKQIAAWVKENATPETHVMVSGLEFTEPERRDRFSENWKPFDVWHPLADAPHLSNCQIIDAVKSLGYPEQALYERRFPHNNCGGACILAGLAQWHALWLEDRETFDYHKKREKQFNEKHRSGKEPFTVLRDQSAKPVEQDGEMVMKRKVTPLTLGRFEQRILSNDIDLQDFRSACGCMLGEQLNMFELLKLD